MSSFLDTNDNPSKLPRFKIKQTRRPDMISTQTMAYVSGDDYRANNYVNNEEGDNLSFWRVPESKHCLPLTLTKVI